MATMKDVSKEAGVALGTVSRYFNGFNVSDDNREKIKDAIIKLDYKPNSFARSMKTNKSMTIAVVIPQLANIFSMRIIESIEKITEGAGYSTIVCNSGSEPEKELEKIRFVISKQVDGIILMPISLDDSEIKKIIGDTPLVLIDRSLPGNSFSCVEINNKQVSHDALTKLISVGAERIGLISAGEEIYTAKKRIEGYKQTLSENEIAFDDDLCFFGGYDIQTGYDGMNHLLEKEIDSVFLTNYEITVGALTAMREKHLTPGKDIKILGFDNQELTNIVAGELLIIAQPIEKIGESAAKILIDSINESTDATTNITLKGMILEKGD